jgi:hypothetical protein
MTFDNLPRMVRVTLPAIAGVLKPGVIRPAICTSFANQAIGTLNLCVFLETGDAQGKANGDTFFVQNIGFTDQDLALPANWGKWFDPIF